MRCDAFGRPPHQYNNKKKTDETRNFKPVCASSAIDVVLRFYAFCRSILYLQFPPSMDASCTRKKQIRLKPDNSHHMHDNAEL